MSSSKPLFVVIGATGAQGGAVISHFLSMNPQPYRLRGVTRNTASTAAKALVEKGVEMVAADLSDKSSLTRAFRDANAIFSVTDYWGPFRSSELRAVAAAEGKLLGVAAYEYERQQGLNVFEAASQLENLDRLIFSSLCDVSKWSGGKYTHVYNYDSKAHALEHAKTAYLDVYAKTSVLQMGFYLENFLPGDHSPFPAKQDSDGVFTFNVFGNDFLVKTICASEDTGPIVHAMLQSPTAGLNVMGFRQGIQLSHLAEVFGKINNVPTKVLIDPNHADKVPAEMKDHFADLGNFVPDIGLFAEEKDGSVIRPDEIGGSLKLGTVEEWIKKQDWSTLLNKASTS